jgi:hypothetical protein
MLPARHHMVHARGDSGPQSIQRHPEDAATPTSNAKAKATRRCGSEAVCMQTDIVALNAASVQTALATCFG